MSKKEEILVRQIERMNDMIDLYDEQIAALEKDLKALEALV